MAIEVRYVGTRSGDQWTDYNYNEINIVENGFLERVPAGAAEPAGQHRRRARRDVPLLRRRAPARRRCRSYLAYFSGLPASQAGDAVGLHVGAVRQQHVRQPAGALQPAAVRRGQRARRRRRRRNNALSAGLPANFLVVNPDLLGGAEITGNGGGTKLQLAAARAAQAPLGRTCSSGQLRLRRCADLENFYSFRRPWEST